MLPIAFTLYHSNAAASERSFDLVSGAQATETISPTKVTAAATYMVLPIPMVSRDIGTRKVPIAAPIRVAETAHPIA